MSIAAGITAIKATLDVAGKLTDLVNRPRIEAKDVQAKLHELLIHAVSAQTALADAKLEMAELRSQLEDRIRLQEFVKNFTFQEGVYWYRDYPYCPNCCDVDQKPMMLNGPTHSSIGPTGTLMWECVMHKSRHHLKERPAWNS
jgi:hypothetical protein